MISCQPKAFLQVSAGRLIPKCLQQVAQTEHVALAVVAAAAVAAVVAAVAVVAVQEHVLLARTLYR